MLKFWMLLALIPVGCADTAQLGSQTQGHAASEIRTGTVVAEIREPYRIEITGSKQRWYARYPGADGQFMTGGEGQAFRDIHVPVNTKVTLVLNSKDYLYVLALPNFKLKEIAVPDLEFQMELCPQEIGQFELVGSPLCGDPHTELDGSLIVEPQEKFFEWLKTAGSESAD